MGILDWDEGRLNGETWGKMKEWEKEEGIYVYCEIKKMLYRPILLWEMEDNEEVSITLILLVFFK